MTVGAMVRGWLDGLAGLLLAWRERRRARHGLLISREDARFVVRTVGRGQESVPHIIVAGAVLPPGVARLAREGTVTFELKEVVVRRIQVPAPAREFLPGIVRNQIERLSPWRANDTVYGFEGALNRDDPATLDVSILMQSRAVIDAVRDRVGAIGLVVHRIVGSDPPLVGPIALWSQLSQASEASLRRVRTLLGAAIAGMLLAWVLAEWLFAQGVWMPFISTEAGVVLALPVGLGFRYLEERRLKAQADTERKELMGLFGRYVSPEVASEIWDHRGEIVLAGQEKTATILFSDIRNFTQITAGKPSAQVLAWLNEYLTEMDDVIRANRGFLNKFIGDGIMVIFG
ncbi:MAG TPA: adenylate/guanylate cyclase domain-containing protein, partial [Xanthobacteraceae bacterium]|nr:adenylate/guanylate cyclase domain-containing protein [Xanthobacteraceae bacterium]